MKNLILTVIAVLLLTVSCSVSDKKCKEKEIGLSSEIERGKAELRSKQLELELQKMLFEQQIDSLQQVIKMQDAEILSLKEKLKKK